MRKPDWAQFLLLYAGAWALAQLFVWTQFPSKYPFIGASIVNVAFVFINLIGAIVAVSTEWVPWRENDQARR